MDVQISLDGATAEVNDYVRGPGSYDMALTALQNLQDAGFKDAKISVVCTRQNIGQLDEFKALADRFGATLRLTRLRPSGRGADVWDELHPLPEQQRELYDWLMAHGEGVLTGDSFFHLAAFGEPLPGLNLCGAGRVVCLIDPIGDVYACPFAIHDNFLAGNLLADGGFQKVWQTSELFARPPLARRPVAPARSAPSTTPAAVAAWPPSSSPVSPSTAPTPSASRGTARRALAGDRSIPAASQDHSKANPTRNQPVMLTLGRRPDVLSVPSAPPVSACAEDPLAGFTP